MDFGVQRYELIERSQTFTLVAAWTFSESIKIKTAGKFNKALSIQLLNVLPLNTLDVLVRKKSARYGNASHFCYSDELTSPSRIAHAGEIEGALYRPTTPPSIKHL